MNSQLRELEDCVVLVHPTKAAALGGDGTEVEVRAAHGRIRGIVRGDEHLSPDAVTIPHGWPAPNVSGLTSAEHDIDPLTGMVGSPRSRSTSSPCSTTRRSSMRGAADVSKNRGTVMGHMALHYRPGDSELARLLLEDLGCTLLDNGPAPGSDGFFTALLDGGRSERADNLFFVARLDASQLTLEETILDVLGHGRAEMHPALKGYLERRQAQAEAVSHFGIRYGSFEQLEQVLARLDDHTRAGGPLAGRVEIFKRIPAPGYSDAVDARIAASPVLSSDEAAGPAKHWVQCRIITDIVGFGIVSLGSEFELDYVFGEWFQSVPSFAPAVDRRRS